MSNVIETTDKVRAKADGSGVFDFLRLLQIEQGQKRPVQGIANGCSSFLQPAALPIQPIAE